MSQRLSAVLWKQLLQRSARENMSLQGQIREMLVSAILDGHLPPGVPIPSSREMAEELEVARNTVVLAYQQLSDEGYLISRQRSGHYVNPEIVAGRGRARRAEGVDDDDVDRRGAAGRNGGGDLRRRDHRKVRRVGRAELHARG